MAFMYGRSLGRIAVRLVVPIMWGRRLLSASTVLRDLCKQTDPLQPEELLG